MATVTFNLDKETQKIINKIDRGVKTFFIKKAILYYSKTDEAKAFFKDECENINEEKDISLEKEKQIQEKQSIKDENAVKMSWD